MLLVKKLSLASIVSCNVSNRYLTPLASQFFTIGTTKTLTLSQVLILLSTFQWSELKELNVIRLLWYSSGEAMSDICRITKHCEYNLLYWLPVLHICITFRCTQNTWNEIFKEKNIYISANRGAIRWRSLDTACRHTERYFIRHAFCCLFKFLFELIWKLHSTYIFVNHSKNKNRYHNLILGKWMSENLREVNIRLYRK